MYENMNLVLGITGSLFVLAQAIVMVVGGMKMRGTPRTLFLLAAACAVAGWLSDFGRGFLSGSSHWMLNIVIMNFLIQLLRTATIVLLVVGGVKAFTSGQMTSMFNRSGAPWSPNTGATSQDSFRAGAPRQDGPVLPQTIAPQPPTAPGSTFPAQPLQGFPEQGLQYQQPSAQ